MKREEYLKELEITKGIASKANVMINYIHYLEHENDMLSDKVAEQAEEIERLKRELKC